MTYKAILHVLFLSFFPMFVFGQAEVPLTAKAYDSWEILKKSEISNQGNFFSYQINPNRGNSKLHLKTFSEELNKVFQRGEEGVFDPNEHFFAFKIKADWDSIYKIDLSKENKEKGSKNLQHPPDTLGIFLLHSQQLLTFPNLKSFQLSQEKKSAITFTQEVSINKEKTPATIPFWQFWKKTDASDEKPEKTKELQLTFFSLPDSTKHVFPNIKQFALSDSARFILFSRILNIEKKDSFELVLFDTDLQLSHSLKTLRGEIPQMGFSKNEKKLFWIQTTDTVAPKNYQLFSYQIFDSIYKSINIIDFNDSALSFDYSINPHQKPYFSENSKRLYFEIYLKEDSVPKHKKIKTDRPNLDLWSWNDLSIQSEQLKTLKQTLTTGLTCVFDFHQNTLLQIETDSLKINWHVKHKNSDILLLSSNSKLNKNRSWSYPVPKDYYLFNNRNGSIVKVLSEINYKAYLSKSNRFLLYFNDSSAQWQMLDIQNNRSFHLTSKIPANFAKEIHEFPYNAPAAGLVGFGKEDAFVILSDNYHLWQINLDDLSFKNLCGNGSAQKKRSFQLIPTQDDKIEYIDLNQEQLMLAFNHESKANELYQWKNDSLVQWYAPNMRLQNIQKAKNTNDFLIRAEDFKNSPHLQVGKLFQKSPQRLHYTNTQQQFYLWGDVSLVKWPYKNGDSLEGLLYTPPQFDANQKYPMIVYFYERNSQTLHHFRHIGPSRSIVNPAYLASNNYLVFVPDIHYEVGYPGKSALECVDSGVDFLLSKGFVDEERIGLQGQSWGGYQTAYIITQTNRYAAAMAGAPVSNMTSAYGGIRWSSGLSRMFQYEATQSRIGGNLWDKKDLYLQNSPIFYLPQVTTPLLIMHNDDDGAVPWYQSLELFLGMRRLNKKCWLLNYNGEPHNLKNWGPRMDLSEKMYGFFDHYLKNQPAPNWMIDGIEAKNKY